MAKGLAAFVVLLCTIQTVLSCPQMQYCMDELDEFFNLTKIHTDFSSLIPYCLNIVNKESSLQQCERDAVQACGFVTGEEEAYVKFQKRKYDARSECERDCPNMDRVKICHGYIKYDIIQSSGYSEFCRHYKNISISCVETELSTCSFRNQLFESGLSSDGKKVVKNICNSGCPIIDETIEKIKSCKQQFSITAQDSRITDCRFYMEYKNCIQGLSPCPQFMTVAQYFTENVTVAMSNCDPTTTSTASTTLPTTTKDSMSSTSTQRTSSTTKLADKATSGSTVSKTGTIKNPSPEVFDKTVKTYPIHVTHYTTIATVKKQNFGLNESNTTNELINGDALPHDSVESVNTPRSDRTYLPLKFLQNNIENNTTNTLTTGDELPRGPTTEESVDTSLSPGIGRTLRPPQKFPQNNLGSSVLAPRFIIVILFGAVSWSFG